MHLRPVLFILGLFAFSCKQRENLAKKNVQSRKATDRLQERYYLIRTLLTFSKRGIPIPANAYVLAAAPPGDSVPIPHVVNAPFYPHHIPDDTLKVPFGTQCHIALANTNLFVNAGTDVVIKDDIRSTKHLYLSGELHVETGKNAICEIETSCWQIKTDQDSKLNIMAYENEPAMIVSLEQGNATVYNNTDTIVLRLPGEVVITSETNGPIKKSGYDYAGASAWKNGMLSGKALNFPMLYRQLERLYHTHIIGEAIDSVYGTYSIPYRKLTLANILESLQNSRKLYYEFSGDSIYITEKK